MLFNEVITVYSEDHKKNHKYKNAALLIDKVAGTYNLLPLSFIGLMKWLLSRNFKNVFSTHFSNVLELVWMRLKMSVHRKYR
jgi:hypothetical protein